MVLTVDVQAYGRERSGVPTVSCHDLVHRGEHPVARRLRASTTEHDAIPILLLVRPDPPPPSPPPPPPVGGGPVLQRPVVSAVAL